MIPAGLKKILAIGSGIGIEIAGPRGSESLDIAAVRVRPTGARVIGRLTIEDFPHQAAGVWGTEYAAFLRKLDLRNMPATVLLPRQEVIVRTLTLPGVGDKDLAAAIHFQLDGLHPYAEEDVVSSWSRLPGTSAVLIAIARRDAVERYATLFSEAGVKVRSFSCTAPAIYSALRVFGAPLPREIFTSEQVNGRVEIYGESPAHPIFSAAFEADDPRAAALACAELRIDPAAGPQPLETLLAAAPALPYSAALDSACPRHTLGLNLLPAERRSSSSRAALVSAIVFAALVLMLAGALFALPGYQDHQYEQTLQSQIAKVEPAARKSAEVEKQITAARERTLLLDDFRRQSKTDMDVLAEMTRILPPQVWLNTLELNRSQVFIAGETDQAAPLLKLIDASPLFESSEFLIPPMRGPNGESFRIKTSREAGK